VTTGHLEDRFGATICTDDPAPLDVKLECNTVPGPDGATVMRLTMTREDFMRFFILVHRTDGTSVAVEITNGTENFVAERPVPPLTKDQAVSLAEQPALATTP
jgi:hypothetical protein